MNDNDQSKDFGYGTGYTSKKDTTDYFVKVRQKTKAQTWFAKIGKNRLIIICAAILLVCIACITTIIIISAQSNNDNTNNNTAVEDEYATLTNFDDDLSNYMFNGGTDEWFDETTNKIIDFIKNSDYPTLSTRARIILANFYSAKGSFQESSNILNEGLEEEGISNQNTLSLLLALADHYRATSQQEELIDTATRIVNLPDDTKIEQGDWPSIKASYQEELKQLTSTGE